MADDKPWLWKPGQTGNARGRPPGIVARDLARAHTQEAIDTLAAALKDKRTCVSAAVALLERGWGKPKEQIEQTNLNYDMGGIDGPPLPETLEQWLERRHTELKQHLQ